METGGTTCCVWGQFSSCTPVLPHFFIFSLEVLTSENVQAFVITACDGLSQVCLTQWLSAQWVRESPLLRP